MDQGQRPIVAILLILLVFLGFSFWNARRGQEQAVDVAEEVASEPAAQSVTQSTAPQNESGSEAEIETPPQAAPLTRAIEAEPGSEAGVSVAEEITTVETDLWTALLSNRGGTVVSWKLKNYEDASGELVELVPPEEGALAVEVKYGTRTVDTSALMFEGAGETVFTLGEGDSFTMLGYKAETADGLRLTRQYTFYPERYDFELYVSVAGVDEPAARRDLVIEWPGVHPTEEREDERADRASVVMVDGKAVRQSLGSLKDEERRTSGDIAWATAQAKYFMAAVVPLGEGFSTVVAGADTSGEAARFRATAGMPEGENAREFLVYAGPQDFQAVSALGAGVEKAVYLGWPWIRPLSGIMLRALIWAHGLVPNYGIVIILFSILTKLLFYRLTHRSFTEMKRMQELQPKLKALQEKYKDKKEELGQKQMELYKKEGVNPLGSCLPMLLQMPVFIALFQVLRTTIELRGAPFALWMTDLSQPDTIATVAGFSIHVLPLLMGVGMLVQQKFSSTDPSQAAMGRLMPIVFTVIFYNMASGLVLYWLVNTVLSIAQQYYIHRGPSSTGETSRDAAARQGVRETGGTPSSEADSTEIVDAEVVEDAPKTSGGSGDRRGKRRRKKRK